MATTKIWSVKKRVDKAVNYVTNKQKTKNKKQKMIVMNMGWINTKILEMY